MAAYRRVYDSPHLQTDCQEPGSAPEPYAQQSSVGYLHLFHLTLLNLIHREAAAISIMSWDISLGYMIFKGLCNGWVSKTDN